MELSDKFDPHQALLLAEKVMFHNCLIAMHPKTKHADLLSMHNVKVYLQNAFVTQLDKLKADIMVSTGTRHKICFLLNRLLGRVLLERF
jgi:hypothetical protein